MRIPQLAALKSVVGLIASCSLILSVGCGMFSSTTAETPEIAPATDAAALGEEVPLQAVAADSLGVNDVFEVRVFGEEELTGVYRVTADGTIAFPLIGTMHASGRSPTQLSEALSEKLSEFIKEPQVTVFVKERHSRKVYVFGEVKSPGTFSFEEGMNIVQAITLAGGFDELANRNGTYVTRKVDGADKRLKVAVKDIAEGRKPNFILKAGDIVFIPETLF